MSADDLELRTTPLMTMTLTLGGGLDLGLTPYGHRRIVSVAHGRFEGEELAGEVVAGGGDWTLQRPDGVLMLDVRLTLRTDDGHSVYMSYRGMRHGPAWVIDRLNKGEAVDPSEYYFRSTPYFETASDKYGWLNRIVAVGVGMRLPAGPAYRIFQVV